MDDDLKRLLLESVGTGKLVVLSGAGLSMAPPTSAPSAAAVAAECRVRYLDHVGTALPLSTDANIENIAQWFWDNNRFPEFIQKFLPWTAFQGPTKGCNAGHTAIADLLACGALETCVTTNFDLFVEMAAAELGEPDFQAIREPEDLGQHYVHSPYLKVYGCCYGGRERLRTVWCKDQLAHGDLADRTSRFRDWLAVNLQDRDLLVVGFWTDWAYLSEILADSLTATAPRHVILVDPSSADALEEKAPELWAWVQGDNIQFTHVQQSGADFLHAFENCYGRVFVTKLVRDAEGTRAAMFQDQPARDPSDYCSDATLYDLRRTLTGTLRHEPVRAKGPEVSRRQLVALHTRLIDKGAQFTGTHYEFENQRIRLVNGSGEVLSSAKSRYCEEPPPPLACDRTVCVGATADHATMNVVRGDREATIIREGTTGAWETHERLAEELRDPT